MTPLVLSGPRFAWQPANRRRHCYLIYDGHPAPVGTNLVALCKLKLVARKASAAEWQWVTCLACAAEARKLLLAAAG